MKALRVGLVFLGAIFLSLASSGCLRDGDAGQTALSQGTPPSACTLLDVTERVFGPLEFRRSTGKPKTETAGFQVPEKGEVCLVVVNGSGPPPHGERISSAWLFIDDVLVIGPEAFSQNVGEISAPHTVDAGQHQLSVKLASVPGSFITVEIRFLAEDRAPPTISLRPAQGELLKIDIPLLEVTYRDEGVGVDLASLGIFLNDMDVTARFSVGGGLASWQLGYEDYLPEGQNLFQASIADRLGNVGRATSIFTVATPLELLLSDLKSGPPAAARRAAIKLLSRRAELSAGDLRFVIKVVIAQRIREAREEVISLLLDRSLDPFIRAMAAAALGEIAEVDAESRTTDLVSAPLADALENDPSWAVRAAVVRSLGQTLRPNALEAVQRYIEPPLPPMPSVHDQVSFEYTKLLALQAMVRLSGDDSLSHNSPTWQDVQDEALDNILQYFQRFPR